MLGKYAFLKYGKPMVAAAPLVLALGGLPSTGYACTLNPNDPPHCINNEGQIIDGFGTFYENNLEGIPGFSNVPGDDFSFNDEEGGDFFNDDDGDQFEIFDDTAPFSNRYFDLAFDGKGNVIYGDIENATPEQDFAATVVAAPQLTHNTTYVAPVIISTYEVLPTPEYVPRTIVAPIQQANSSFVATPGVSAGPVGSYEFNNPGFDPLDGSISPTFELFFDSIPNGPDYGSCSQGAPAACSASLDALNTQLEDVIPAEHAAAIFNAVPFNDDDDGAAYTLDTNFDFFSRNAPVVIQLQIDPNALVIGNVDGGADGPVTPIPIGFNDDDGDAIGLARDMYQHYAVPLQDKPQTLNVTVNTQTSTPAADAPATATPENPVNKLAAGLERLRERARTETNPEKKAELEQRVRAFERTIGHLGSASMRTAVSIQDSNTAPAPTR